MAGKLPSADDESATGPLPAVLVASRFDAQQRAALTSPPTEALLIVGGAGCGKTTVALHRLAWLCRHDPARFSEADLQVVAPEPGLAWRSQAVLGDLHLYRARSEAFDAWITREARRVFRDLPPGESAARPAAVIALKRHPALLPVLARFVERLGLELAARLDRRLAARGRVRALWPTLHAAGDPLRAQLARLSQQVLKETPTSLEAETRAALGAEERRLFGVREDLLELFGDRAWLAEVVAGSAGELLPGTAADVIAHTRVQLRPTGDDEYAHVDAHRRVAVDGRALDAGTPDEEAACVDPEDYAVAFALLFLKTGGCDTPGESMRAVAALVVDEAQDLAPIELAALRQSLSAELDEDGHPSLGLTVCGDPAQQSDRDVRFPGWDAVLGTLGAASYRRIQLRTSYRCTTEIARFAEGVLGPLADDNLPTAGRSGPPVCRVHVDDEAALKRDLTNALQQRAAAAHPERIAVICASPTRARALIAALAPLGPRLALGDEPPARWAGLEVTTVSAAKGLEYDLVVVPDAIAAEYGDEPAARRRLYVACTRARTELWVFTFGLPSPLLASVGESAAGGGDR